MFQVEVLKGGRFLSTHQMGGFPFTIGRSSQSSLRLEGDGVWDKHLEFTLNPRDNHGVMLRTWNHSRAVLSGKSVEQAVLRNGDTLELGAFKLRFWLAETSQHRLEAREMMTWSILGAVALTQIALAYGLLGP